MNTILMSSVAARFENVVGASHVRTDRADLSNYEIDGVAPAIALQPATAEEAAHIVRIAVEQKCTVIPCGARTSLALGLTPERYDVALDMTRVAGIVHYDPGDLTISVNAGTRLTALASVLAEKHQFLPLEVPFFQRATVGGVIASGLDSPLRHFYGTARDFVIGAEFVDGTGALAKSGGRVVKNVTGYDFHKLMNGSLGSLAVITRVNFRTFPLPALRRGFLASFVDQDGALGFVGEVAASALTPAVSDIISPEFASFFLAKRLSPGSAVFDKQTWTVCIGFEGSNEMCTRYERELKALARAALARDAMIVNDIEFRELLDVLREAPALMSKKGTTQSVVVRCVTLPSNMRELLRVLRNRASSSQVSTAVLIRSASVVYVALSSREEDATGLKQIASVCNEVGNLRAEMELSAAILFCPREWKPELCTFGQTADSLDIARRVKKAFDPDGTFVSGRFVGGI